MKYLSKALKMKSLLNYGHKAKNLYCFPTILFTREKSDKQVWRMDISEHYHPIISVKKSEKNGE